MRRINGKLSFYFLFHLFKIHSYIKIRLKHFCLRNIFESDGRSTLRVSLSIKSPHTSTGATMLAVTTVTCSLRRVNSA